MPPDALENSLPNPFNPLTDTPGSRPLPTSGWKLSDSPIFGTNLGSRNLDLLRNPQLDAVGCTEVAGLYWGDEMRVGLIGQTRKIWAPRGVKVMQVVEYQHVWTYLNLAVNGLTGQLRWRWTANMKSESIAPVVQQWGTEGVAVIVWDRARGHHGSAYAAVEVHRIEQPPYSPELNPAERVFEYLRAHIEGKVYGAIEAKQQAIEAAEQADRQS